MEQLTKNQAVATSQEAVQNQNEPQLRDENAHNDKSVHGVLNPTYQAGLRRDAVQPDIEAERKKRDEIEAGKSYCSRRFGGATCDDKSAQIYARFDKNDWRIQPAEFYRFHDAAVRFQTALASIKLIQASAVLDLTEDDFDFLTSNKVWIATDRSRARRCVEACVYGTLDFVGYPPFPAPVEFIAAVIAYYVHPVNIQTACLIMEGAEFTENIINGVERPVKAAELFAFTLRVRAGNTDVLTDAEENVRQKLRAEGVM